MGAADPSAALGDRTFSGNVRLHHVHHLSTKVPNCELQRADDENEVCHGVPAPEWGRPLGWREVRARS